MNSPIASSFSTDFLRNGAESIGFSLSSEQLEQFVIFYELLIEKNKVMNLTAITEWQDVVEKHFLDSLCLAKVLPQLLGPVSDTAPLRILDLGTGAGFPGIPLRIACPSPSFVLMDSLNKRILFLQEVIESLSLTEIEAVHGRAEEAARNQLYREAFSLCTSRAVANLSTLSEYCLPFVKTGGLFIAYKSGSVEEELKASKGALHLLGGRLKEVHTYRVPGTDLDRSLIVIEKIRPTSKAYPRKAGLPGKQPLH